MRRVVSLLSLLLWSSLALAETWYIEGPPVASRADAVAMSQVAKAAGYKARVVRRFRHGDGWEYVFVADGFSERLQASEAARVVADQTGRGVSVYGGDGADVTLAEAVAPSGSAPSTEPAAEPAVVRRPSGRRLPADADVDAVLKAAVAAHGGGRGGLAVLKDAETVRFRFRRTLPDGTVTVHTYARRGAERYLDVRVESGDGKASVLRALDGGAFLTVDGGSATRGDLKRSLETVERFSPERILDLSLSFVADVEARAELQKLHLDGTTTVDGEVCRVLRFDGDRVSRGIALAVSEEDNLLLQLATGGEGGGVVKSFSSYEELSPGLIVPKAINSYRHRELVDSVEVLELSVGTRLPDEWLAIPGD